MLPVSILHFSLSLISRGVGGETKHRVVAHFSRGCYRQSPAPCTPAHFSLFPTGVSFVAYAKRCVHYMKCENGVILHGHVVLKRTCVVKLHVH